MGSEIDRPGSTNTEKTVSLKSVLSRLAVKLLLNSTFNGGSMAPTKTYST